MCICTSASSSLMTLVLAAVNDRMNESRRFVRLWLATPTKNCIDSVIALIISTLLYYVKLIN